MEVVVWQIETTERFDRWLMSLDDTDRACMLAGLIVLRQKGPGLCRPYADSIKGSCFSNMKELRVQSKGDPIRAFLPSTHGEQESCFVQAARWVMKSAFMPR